MSPRLANRMSAGLGGLVFLRNPKVVGSRKGFSDIVAGSAAKIAEIASQVHHCDGCSMRRPTIFEPVRPRKFIDHLEVFALPQAER